MPHTFHATVHRIQSDQDQETTLILKIPTSSYDQVAPLGKLTKQVLLVTVFTQTEVRTDGGTDHETAD